MIRSAWFLAHMTLVACGNSAGLSPVSSDDATTADLQSSSTDATGTDATGTDALHVDAMDVAPDVADGTDAASPDVSATACAPVYEGAIPGAALDLTKTPCTFSISAAHGVFNLAYGLTISSANTLSLDGTSGGCQPPASAFHGGIAAGEHVSGGGQSWCLCDVGLCAPTGSPFTATVPGSYMVNFTWDGNNWNGPSDTGNKPGAAFPPGSYVFTVNVSGKREAPDGAIQPFSAAATLPIVLTP